MPLLHNLASLTTLQKLDLSRNFDLGSRAFEALAQLVGRSTSSLTWLSLENTHLEDPSLVPLCQAMANIKYLNLSRNHISDLGASAMGELLRTSPQLTALDLSWNHIRAAGGVALSQGLVTSSLETLDLSFNSISSLDGSVGEALGAGLGDHKVRSAISMAGREASSIYRMSLSLSYRLTA